MWVCCMYVGGCGRVGVGVWVRMYGDECGDVGGCISHTRAIDVEHVAPLCVFLCMCVDVIWTLHVRAILG